ncbi:hypothetical protein [Candidatus Endomicrobiellum agilis]|jgi:hypothetical protein|uniref:hypothetical protein n=1 Tax=Candidatus Endomicrobiellum agilis TaxID=3238957 RepID=UPI00357F7945|nr:hypothetical protein [Endomicrobium sp.]
MEQNDIGKTQTESRKAQAKVVSNQIKAKKNYLYQTGLRKKVVEFPEDEQPTERQNPSENTDQNSESAGGA